MAHPPKKILMCSCEDTMPLDHSAMARGCGGAEIVSGRQLCRAELDRFRALAASGAPLTVACTQEAPLFREAAGGADLTFANLRENAGWSSEAARAGPKMAALAAAAAVPLPETSFVRLESSGVKTGTIHSNRSQNQRLRALKDFKSGAVRVLVATDVAARGIDVDGISHVVNYDFPMHPEDYVHRIGRTGRAHAVGEAISFVSPEDHGALRSLERFIGRGIVRKRAEGFNYSASAPHVPDSRESNRRPQQGNGNSRNHPPARNARGGSSGPSKRFSFARSARANFWPAIDRRCDQ